MPRLTSALIVSAFGCFAVPAAVLAQGAAPQAQADPITLPTVTVIAQEGAGPTPRSCR